MEKRLAGQDLTFDPLIDADDDHAFAPAQYLPSPAADPAQLVLADDWQDQASERLADALQLLDERSRDILQSRWLGDRKATLHELAERYGVSAERIRQIEQQAIRKLRQQMVA